MVLLLDIIKFIFNTKPKKGNYAGKIFGTKITITECKGGVVTYYFSKSVYPEMRFMTYRQFHITGYRRVNEIYYEEGEAIGCNCLKDSASTTGYEFTGKSAIKGAIK